MAELLMNSEKTVEKYRKKVDEVTDLRQEIRASPLRLIATRQLTIGQDLKAANATLADATANIEFELKKFRLIKSSVDSCHSHVETFEAMMSDEASRVRACLRGIQLIC
jgi:hypothetical protein